MLSEQIIDSQERLYPMFKDALSRLSFGLEIMSTQYLCMPQQVQGGVIPMYGIVYQCRGILLGTVNYLSQISGVSDPFATQEQIDKVIQQGCQQLLQNQRAQGQLQNGSKQ